VAAAAAGQLSGQRRAFGVAVFYCAGMFGGITGNITAPLWVRHFGHGSAEAGLKSLAWFIVPGLLSVVLLAWATHPVAHRHQDAHASHASLDPAERSRRWYAVGVLYFVNVLRFTVDLAVITLVIRWSEALTLERAATDTLTEQLRTQAATLNGPLQAAKQIGMGVGGLAIGWFMRPRFEKPMMICVPLLGAAMIALMPHSATWTLAFLVTVVAGLGYGGMVPATIALAQRLLPHRTGLASGLMMGGAWAVGSAGAPLAEFLHRGLGLNGAFLCVAGLAVLSGLLAFAVPRSAIRA
jgi:FSR family fosmidomycin resistance protein-like MFS transporter